MSNMLTHEGYFSFVQYSEENRIFHGKIEFIHSLVSYEGTDVNSLEASFKDVVDDYIEFCEEQGKEPEHPFKGSFNVCAGTDLHRQAALYTQRNGLNLNKIGVEALKRDLSA